MVSELNLVLILLDCAKCQSRHHFLTLEKLQEIFSAKVSVSIRNKVAVFTDFYAFATRQCQ